MLTYFPVLEASWKSNFIEGLMPACIPLSLFDKTLTSVYHNHPDLKALYRMPKGLNGVSQHHGALTVRKTTTGASQQRLRALPRSTHSDTRTFGERGRCSSARINAAVGLEYWSEDSTMSERPLRIVQTCIRSGTDLQAVIQRMLAACLQP